MRIKQYTRAEIREMTLKRWKERHKEDKKIKEVQNDIMQKLRSSMEKM